MALRASLANNASCSLPKSSSANLESMTQLMVADENRAEARREARSSSSAFVRKIQAESSLVTQNRSRSSDSFTELYDVDPLTAITVQLLCRSRLTSADASAVFLNAKVFFASSADTCMSLPFSKTKPDFSWYFEFRTG